MHLATSMFVAVSLRMQAFQSFLVTGGLLAAIATTGCETSKPGSATPDSGIPNESGAPVAGGDSGDEIADASDAADIDAADMGVAASTPTLHRAISSPCTQPRPPGNPGPGCAYFEAGPGDCTTDQDCKSGQNGRCNCMATDSTPRTMNLCSYDTCMSDSDCHGTVCSCREDPARVDWGTQTFCFKSGNCLTDSDCGPAGYCSPSLSPGCGPGSWYGYFCHTAGDACLNDRDCTQGNAYCAYDQTRARWICATAVCGDA